MKRRDFMTAAAATLSARTLFSPAIPAAASTVASAVALPEGEGRMAYLVDRLFALRDAFQIAPDPGGSFDSPECRALDAEIWRFEDEIEACPIRCAGDPGAYARYLAREAEVFEIAPVGFAKFIAWAEATRPAA